MKREIFVVVTSLVAGLGFTDFGNKPSEPEVSFIEKPAQVVLTNVSPTPRREYNIAICPVVGDGRSYTQMSHSATEYDSSIQETRHCPDCQAGALSPVEEGSTTLRCSFCEHRFPDSH